MPAARSAHTLTQQDSASEGPGSRHLHHCIQAASAEVLVPFCKHLHHGGSQVPHAVVQAYFCIAQACTILSVDVSIHLGACVACQCCLLSLVIHIDGKLSRVVPFHRNDALCEVHTMSRHIQQ